MITVFLKILIASWKFSEVSATNNIRHQYMIWKQIPHCRNSYKSPIEKS